MQYNRKEKLVVFALLLVLTMLLSGAAVVAQVTSNTGADCQVASPADCPPQGSQEPPPPGRPSVAVVTGGEKQDIMLACGFLTGKTPGGAAWSNWAPDSWCKRYMNPPPDEAGDLYRDRPGLPPNDAKPPNGVDSGPMLLFYSGHGSLGWLGCASGGWQAAGITADQQAVCLNDVLLGNGHLLYLWQCSCNVMAHGKRSIQDNDYTNPQSFSFSGDGSEEDGDRNAFWRWPRHIGAGLRMACGGTSSICGANQAVGERIWDNYNNKKYQVADSFLEGVFNAPSGVPLCLTRGKEDPASTPLYDGEFLTKPNPYNPNADGPPYFHLLYPVRFGNESFPKSTASSPQAGTYPIFHFADISYKDFCKSGEADPEGRCVARSLNSPEALPEHIDVRSGARYVLGATVGAPMLLVGSPEQWEESRFFTRALEVVRRQGWLETHYRGPEGMRLVIETAVESKQGENAKRWQKEVLVRFKRQIPVDRGPGSEELVNVLGPGGEMSVLLNNDGTVIRAAKIWRPVDGDIAEKVEKIDKKRARTKEEALSVLQGGADWQRNSRVYQAEPAYYVWGYKEETGNCRQKVMRLVYQFTFLPKENTDYQGYAPLTLEVPAQVLPEDDGAQSTEPCYPNNSR